MRKGSLNPNTTDNVEPTTSWKNEPGASCVLVNDQGLIRRHDPKLGWAMPYQPKQEVSGYRRFYHTGALGRLRAAERGEAVRPAGGRRG